MESSHKDRTISLRKYLTQGVFWSFTLKVSSVCLGLATNILLARSLGPNEFGTYAYIMSLIALLSIPASLGLPEFLVREISKYSLQKQWKLLKGLLFRANQAVLLVGTGLILVLILLTSIYHWGQREAFLVTLPLLLISSLNNIRQAILRGLRHVILGQLPEFTIRPLIFCSLIFVIWLFGINYNAIQVLGLQVFSSAFAFLGGVFLLIKVLPKEAKRAGKQCKTKLWLKESLPFLFLGTAYFINNQTDIVMLGMFRSIAEVGIYKIAIQGAQLVIFILMAVNTTIGPVISELYHFGDIEKLRRIVTLSARVVLAGSLPACLIFIILGEPIISFVFGSEYRVASYPLTILCLGQIANAGMGSVGLILNMTGNEKDTLKGVTISAALNVALNALLIPRFGVQGAAWATTISMVCWNLILSGLVNKRLGIWAHAYSKVKNPNL